MAGSLLEFTDANWKSEVLEASEPVMVDFWAPWCGPCRVLSPTIEKLAGEYQGKVRIGKVNLDEHQALASKYRVTAIPTLLMIKNGEVVEQMVGAKSKRDLKASLDRAIA